MWLLGIFIGLSVGAVTSPNLWFAGALIGVAVLVLAASYFAPLPPREENSSLSDA